MISGPSGSPTDHWGWLGSESVSHRLPVNSDCVLRYFPPKKPPNYLLLYKFHFIRNNIHLPYSLTYVSLVKPSTLLAPIPRETSETELEDPPTSGSASKLSTNLPSWQMHRRRSRILLQTSTWVAARQMTQNSSVGTFKAGSRLGWPGSFTENMLTPGPPPGMIFQPVAGGAAESVPTALSEKQHPSEHL